LAQIGSFVPAKHAEIGLLDKIFTRVGATDNISAGESTFMVEMNEAANILNNISERSLILLDEMVVELLRMTEFPLHGQLQNIFISIPHRQKPYLLHITHRTE
jgi:hypothetical protein